MSLLTGRCNLSLRGLHGEYYQNKHKQTKINIMRISGVKVASYIVYNTVHGVLTQLPFL